MFGIVEPNPQICIRRGAWHTRLVLSSTCKYSSSKSHKWGVVLVSFIVGEAAKHITSLNNLTKAIKPLMRSSDWDAVGATMTLSQHVALRVATCLRKQLPKRSHHVGPSSSSMAVLGLLGWITPPGHKRVDIQTRHSFMEVLCWFQIRELNLESLCFCFGTWGLWRCDSHLDELSMVHWESQVAAISVMWSCQCSRPPTYLRNLVVVLGLSSIKGLCKNKSEV